PDRERSRAAEAGRGPREIRARARGTAERAAGPRGGNGAAAPGADPPPAGAIRLRGPRSAGRASEQGPACARGPGRATRKRASSPGRRRPARRRRARRIARARPDRPRLRRRAGERRLLHRLRARPGAGSGARAQLRGALRDRVDHRPRLLAGVGAREPSAAGGRARAARAHVRRAGATLPRPAAKARRARPAPAGARRAHGEPPSSGPGHRRTGADLRRRRLPDHGAGRPVDAPGRGRAGQTADRRGALRRAAGAGTARDSAVGPKAGAPAGAVPRWRQGVSASHGRLRTPRRKRRPFRRPRASGDPGRRPLPGARGVSQGDPRRDEEEGARCLPGASPGLLRGDRQMRAALVVAGLISLGGATHAGARAIAGLAEAEEALSAWDVPRAALVAERLVSERPDDPRVLHLLGRVRHYQGRYAEAAELFRRVGDEDLARLAADTHEITKNHQRQESEHFVFLYPPGKDEILAPWALETLEAAWERVGELLGYRPEEEKIRVEVVQSAEELARVSTLSLEAIRNTGTIAVCKFDKLMVTSPRALLRGYDWRDTLSHEYIHL